MTVAGALCSFALVSFDLWGAVAGSREDVVAEAEPVHSLRALVVVGWEVGGAGAGPVDEARLPLLVVDAEATLPADFAQVARDGARLPVRLFRPLRSHVIYAVPSPFESGMSKKK